MVDIEFTWKHNRNMRDAAKRLQELQETVSTNLEDAAEEISLSVMADAARNAPVDTGRLRASIDQDVERVTRHTVKALVGSNVEYAPIQEVDQPYLRPAFEANRKDIRRLVNKALDNAVEEVS